MKKLTVAVLFMSLIVGASTLRADDALHDAMEKMNDAYKTLARGLRRPDTAKKSEYLKAAENLQAGIMIAKQQVPHSVAEKAGDEQKKMAADYRIMMIQTMEAALKVEKALLMDKFDEAKAAVDELKSLKSKGHEKYR